jgi:hypothetical protein
MEQRRLDDEVSIAGDVAPVLIDLPAVVSVHPRRSVWGAFLLAMMTGLTALGFGVAAIQPRIIDRAQDRGPAEATPSTPPGAATFVREPIVAVARSLASGRPGPARLVVSGAARPDITRVDVIVALGGPRVASSTVLLGGRTGVEMPDQPWSAIVDIPPGPVPPDAVATVTLRWVATHDDTGTTALVVALGDGRGRR